ncbi:MAG: D-glycerate dehydrogenase [Proteobacteria bacterium]|nr:D-glycerate dehydrogenase [Pseudomonadota bacterium]
MASRPRVFVTRRLPGAALERLRERTAAEVWENPSRPSRSALRAAVAEAEGLLCLLGDDIDAALIAAAPRLRVISSYSTGVDHIDLAAARERGIPVGHTPGVLTEATADLAFALLLSAARRLPEAHECVQSGRWARGPGWEPDFLLGRELHGATLGIVGAGAIGQAVARRARGFGLHVLAWNRTPRRLPELEFTSLDELLARSDFVSVHVALTPETRGLLDARALARMKPDAILVNTARGGIVDEAALADALREGRLAGAGLDVFEREPLPEDHPLATAPGVALAPHVGSATHATRARMAELAVDNLLAGLEGRPLPHCANG